jgi:hypothetical protein
VLLNVDVPIDIGELWGNMMGGHSGYWADNFETLDSGIVQWYLEDEEFTPNPQDFKVFADGEWYEVTVEKLARAYVRLKLDGWTHCGGDSVDEQDSCTGDAILQVAAFGDFVYG